jgi:acyl-CoA reductase-like NAD-dependent aldehyde dehydrogenase
VTGPNSTARWPPRRPHSTTGKADEGRRRAALLDAAELIETSVGTLAPLLTREQGKPLPEAKAEVVGSCAWLRYYANMDCGQVSVNAHGAGLRPDFPFGGHKWSGLGVENGRWGLEGFTDLQVLIRPAR